MLSEDNLIHYKSVYTVHWVGDLPENCPPKDILVPEDEVFYRYLIHKDSVVEDDWKSYVELYPNKHFNEDELILANGLSISNDGNYQNLIKLPYLRKKFKGIARLKLHAIDGVVKKTRNQIWHYTWWRTTSFDINSAEIIDNEEA